MTLALTRDLHPRASTPPQVSGLRLWSIVNSLTSGGAEIFVTSLHAALANRGLATTTLALCDAQALGNSQAMEARLAERLDQCGSRFASLGLDARRSTLKGAAALRRLFASEGRPQVIHAHTVRAIPICALAGWRGPLVVTHHNSRLSFAPRMFTLFDFFVDHWVAISPDVAAHYRRHSRRAHTPIANAPDSQFTVDTPRTTPGEPPRILSVGAISDQKHYELLIETAASLRAISTHGSMPIFEIAGGGEGLPTLSAAVKARGLEDHVHFLGERDDVPALMARADCLLNTSRYEGMPVSLLEAFAMALPVVATAVAGNRDLVQGDVNGLLATEEPQALAGAIRRMFDEPGLYARLSAGSLASRERYSMNAAASRHLALYEHLCASGAAAKPIGPARTD
ncbi:glycosyltransferase [Novosphingobium sp. YJ-S2-02]|uniref:Glycosyltransferase n=1 Tax=Novosphingobium aureum TaxID=2792964 RepID=A0A931MLA7_9SPHN|nr:glycosyltransferase [Novosphingobium aureum]MBH0113708.1 glycosyltransferase [Novosphingobium aureum]